MTVPVTVDGTVIVSVGANKAIDAAGNANTASTSTDNTVLFDTTPPTVLSITRVETGPDEREHRPLDRHVQRVGHGCGHR